MYIVFKDNYTVQLTPVNSLLATETSTTVFVSANNEKYIEFDSSTEIDIYTSAEDALKRYNELVAQLRSKTQTKEL